MGPVDPLSLSLSLKSFQLTVTKLNAFCCRGASRRRSLPRKIYDKSRTSFQKREFWNKESWKSSRSVLLVWRKPAEITSISGRVGSAAIKIYSKFPRWPVGRAPKSELNEILLQKRVVRLAAGKRGMSPKEMLAPGEIHPDRVKFDANQVATTFFSFLKKTRKYSVETQKWVLVGGPRIDYVDLSSQIRSTYTKKIILLSSFVCPSLSYWVVTPYEA